MPGAALGDVLTDAEPVRADRAALFPLAVDALAAVHAVDVARHLDGWGERLELDAVVDRWGRMLDRYGEPGRAPAAVASLRRHLPANPGRVGLAHGDFYSNNWLFDGGRSARSSTGRRPTSGPRRRIWAGSRAENRADQGADVAS